VLTLVWVASAALPASARNQGLALARAAEAQVGVTVRYDPSYTRIAFPGGDLPPDRGVCADVIVRAFRRIGIDLQAAVHQDMQRHFGAYPQLWGMREPDTNIDHRRVPNLMTYFLRQGKAQPLAAGFESGDVVAWRLPAGLLHIGILSTRLAADGIHPLAVHNIGQGARIEDILHAYQIIGHYRW
jgi:uncharacterized protein